MWSTLKQWLDWSAVGVAIGTVASWLPPIAALFSIVWLSIQMYDRFNKKPDEK